MTFEDVLKKAKDQVGPYCKTCSKCDGRACKNSIPGPGAKGSGTVAINNYNAWKNITLNLDTIYEQSEISTESILFNQKLSIPVFAGPIGGTKSHYGDKYSDSEYDNLLVKSCVESGIVAFTGDGLNLDIMTEASKIIKDNNGLGIPTIKPWNLKTFKERFDLVLKSDPIAIAMDIDSIGLPFLKNQNPPAGAKSVGELKEIVSWSNKPFIVKGIMTVSGALKALEAGASAIIVSNHGGRVLDYAEPTANVLFNIAKAVNGRMTVLVDGGIRDGSDIFKALALGANGVLIARRFQTMVYGDSSVGVSLYVEKLKGELEDVMRMCGANSISEIKYSMVNNCFK